MVTASDLVTTPPSSNVFITALSHTRIYRPGYEVTYVLEGNPGDTGVFGGALWAAKGAAQAFAGAAAAWAAVANIKITGVQVAFDGSQSRAGYTWVESLTALEEGVLGQHNLPGVGNLGGDFGNTHTLFTAANNAVGGYSFLTFLHEIGHGLGLTHPHDEDHPFPGVTGDDSGDLGDHQFNQSIYTVMSYNDTFTDQYNPSYSYGYAATPMAFDIAAIQHFYGANMSTATGDNVYVLPTNSGTGSFWACIWDAGGIDVIDASAANRNTKIVLLAATLRNEEGGGGFVSQADGVSGGYTIANGVVIENATGGAHDDTIVGNEAANRILGNGGSDLLMGHFGADYIEGGDGGDRIYGLGDLASLDDADGASQLFGGGGDDTLYGAGGGDTLSGDDGWDTLRGGGGNDLLIGGSGNDTMYGGAGVDVFSGGADSDTYYVDAGELVYESLTDAGTDAVHSTASFYLFAGVENLVLVFDSSAEYGVGNALDNEMTGNGLANLLIAGAGADRVRGYGGNDLMFGEEGDDQLWGSEGIDYLVGGAGNDVLKGEWGADALYGEDGDDILEGEGGDPGGGIIPTLPDFVTDILVGGAGNDILRGNSGRGDYDLMDGGSGNDAYYVDTPDDLTFEATDGGTDTVYATIIGAGYYLYANTENLVLGGSTPFGVGNALANTMTGSSSSNWLLGGDGKDVLNGKAGNDVLFGEGGVDRFIFEVGTGGDVIGDFEPGTDRIDLSAFGMSWQAVLNSMHENGGTTAIDLGNGDLIVLNGVAAAALNQSDFILAAGTPAAAAAPTTAIFPSAAIEAGLLRDFVPHLSLKLDGALSPDLF